MASGLIDYVNATTFESFMVNVLIDKLNYLSSIRKSIASDLQDVDKMIDEIILEMETVGIFVDKESLQ
jgi:hypothetical protein